jgi:hypothetical protein
MPLSEGLPFKQYAAHLVIYLSFIFPIIYYYYYLIYLLIHVSGDVFESNMQNGWQDQNVLIHVKAGTARSVSMSEAACSHVKQARHALLSLSEIDSRASHCMPIACEWG